MCPPAPIPPAVGLDEYSTDETIIKFLMQLKGGQSLPLNVLSEVNPYQVTPSNLPAGMWYVWSGSKTDTKNGFWRSTGEACEIYKTSLIIGLRKTLLFHEGPANDGQKTNWIMQEYTTTEKYTSKQDPRALYRVFLVDDSSSGSGHLSNSELLVNNIDDVVGPSDVANQSSDQLLDDNVLEGDFLELDDLAIPLSRTTSSADSSCMTSSMASEELFDSDALLRELGDDIVDQEMQDSSIKLNLSAPAKLKQVVMQPTTLGSIDNVKESKPCTGQTSKTNPTLENKSTSNEVDTLPPSSSSSSSKSSEGSSKEEKKEHASRTKKRKMMKYLCFLAF
ncbi:hypothetical protein L1987_44658 [Smallanthus sonchifolius]|uniref:Uncharacterized protein n=1 Tax=Smallanthus sonchifolius TaxID=185202 RepID=A0ACB9GQ11_9ASTR|nr:hypothetical protein L1987_44658 [Smallanthus sonchifolius]